MSIKGQGHFFTIYFPGFYVLCLIRPRYQMSVYRTIGPLVLGNILKKPITRILVINIFNQRTIGPVNTHLISWPSKAQNIQNLENIW